MTIRCFWCSKEAEFSESVLFAHGFYHPKCLEKMKKALRKEGWQLCEETMKND